MEKTKVKLLKEKQDALEDAKALFKVKKLEFEKLNAGAIREIEILEDSCESTKQEIKIEAIADFDKTGVKQLYGGIGIRISTKLDYTQKDAIEWAAENMPIAILTVLDKKQFETYAKKNELGFVTAEKTTTVTFPKELII